MVSFNDGTAGPDAEALATFLEKNGVPTFCTKVWCQRNAGNWRDATEEGANCCKIYIALMTDGWQRSDECQIETQHVKNRVVTPGEVKIIPVHYVSFDNKFDDRMGHHYKNNWKSHQGSFRTSRTWMQDVLNLIPSADAKVASVVRASRPRRPPRGWRSDRFTHALAAACRSAPRRSPPRHVARARTRARPPASTRRIRSSPRRPRSLAPGALSSPVSPARPLRSTLDETARETASCAT